MAGPKDADGDGLAPLLAEAERRAERVAAAVRISVALFLGSAFLLAVVGSVPPDDAMLADQIRTAEATLVGYLLVGIVSFHLSAPGRARRWHSFLFVTLDVAFVVASLWLNRITSGLSANYLPALPGVFLIPLILTFGALRYGPALQAWIIALFLVGIGSLALAPGAFEDVLGKPPPPEINAFFAGPPNIMRAVMVLAAGLVLLLVVVRTRRLLADALEETRRRLLLARYLPAEIAPLLTGPEGEDLRTGRRQAVVVLFVDVRGFTARSEGMAPEALGAFLARLRREVGEAARAAGGIVDKFVGDGAMVVFGVPEPGADDTRRAVAMARDLSARVVAWSAELAAAGAAPVTVGIGLHAGEAFVGAIGEGERLEFTVVGDTVNVAARVEAATKATGHAILATDAVRALAGGAEDWTDVGETPLRGRARPVRLWAPPAATAPAAGGRA